MFTIVWEKRLNLIIKWVSFKVTVVSEMKILQTHNLAPSKLLDSTGLPWVTWPPMFPSLPCWTLWHHVQHLNLFGPTISMCTCQPGSPRYLWATHQIWWVPFIGWVTVKKFSIKHCALFSDLVLICGTVYFKRSPESMMTESKKKNPWWIWKTVDKVCFVERGFGLYHIVELKRTDHGIQKVTWPTISFNFTWYHKKASITCWILPLAPPKHILLLFFYWFSTELTVAVTHETTSSA